jgi:hypothetical protein
MSLPLPSVLVPVLAKCHALRDEFSEVRSFTGAMNRHSKIVLSTQRELIGNAMRSQLRVLRTSREILDAPGHISDALSRESMSAASGSGLSPIRHASRGESWYSYCALSDARQERAGHGR